MIKKIFFLFLFINILTAKDCYSILTKLGLFTPVYPYNFKNYKHLIKTKDNEYIKSKILWNDDLAYVGCFKTYNEAKYVLNHLNFNFKNPKIIHHKLNFEDKYVIFPNKADVNSTNIYKLIDKYKPEKLIKYFPKKFYGNGIDIVDFDKFLIGPTINLYELYKYYKKHNYNQKILVLYNGVYNLEYIYKKINNSKIIQKINNNTYIIKYPIFISPTAKLIINNKKVLLEAVPNPVFIMYYGEMYAKNSKFISWNLIKNKYAKREKIPKEKLLLIGVHTPKPYILGLSGSVSYFINNIFRGLGFHSTKATFGLSIVKFPNGIYLNNLLFNYLNSRGKPTGYFIGNSMYDNLMGFYCSNAYKVVLIGNLMYDNVIYNIDPHDYSDYLIIARNITAKAKNAHGIVVSRSVEHVTIAENITFNNHSAGIMLDRNSNYGYIYNNLSFLNGYMGISVQESDDALIEDNKIIGNKIDGLMLRNSLRNTVKNNYIVFNKKNGIEILTKKINYLSYRNFTRDPYHLATSAVIENNKIIKNLLYNITAKNNPALQLKNNIIKSEFNTVFGGELNIFTDKIIKDNSDFKLYGVGNPFEPLSSDIKQYLTGEKSKISLKSKLYIAGFNLLIKAKNKQEYKIALRYIIESVILGNEQAGRTIALLKYFFNVNKNDINKEFDIALRSLKKRMKMTDNYKEKILINSALHEFSLKYKLSKSKDFYEFCKLKLDKYSIFIPERILKIENVFRKVNNPKLKYYKKMTENNQKINTKIKYRKKILKQQFIDKSLDEYYNHNKQEIFNIVKKYLPLYLKKVNEFRIEKVDMKTIKKLME